MTASATVVRTPLHGNSKPLIRSSNSYTKARQNHLMYWVSHLMSYSPNTRGCVPVHVHYSNLPNFVLYAGATLLSNVVKFLSKWMETGTSIYLFLMSGMNFSLELSDYWAFSLVHAACKLQSVVVRITATWFCIYREYKDDFSLKWTS